MAGGVSSDDLKWVLKVGADTTEAERVIASMFGRIPKHDMFIKSRQPAEFDIKAATERMEKYAERLAIGGKWLGDLGGPLGPVGVGFDVATAGLGKAAKAIQKTPGGDLIGPMMEQLAGIPSIFKNITSTLVEFSAVASPGAFAQWQRAIADVQGVIGGAFVPVLQLMTGAVRMFGDVLANILPNANEVREALDGFRQAFGEIGDEFKAVLAEIGPIIRNVLIFALHQVANVLTLVAKALGPFIDALGRLLRVLTGRPEGKPGDLRTSEGAAARPAQIMSLDEYHRQNILSAYREPGALSAAEQTAKNTKDTADLLEKIKESLAEKLSQQSPNSGSVSQELAAAKIDDAKATNRLLTADEIEAVQKAWKKRSW